MIWHFLLTATRSPARQQMFRRFLVIEIIVLAVAILLCAARRDTAVLAIVGDASLLLGIVQGALIIGWRLVQWPKSQALETLLLANLSSAAVMRGEQFVGIVQLVALALASVPILSFAIVMGWLPLLSVWLIPLNMLLASSVVGFGLVWWVYEPLWLRRWGERLAGTLLIAYFVVGGLAGEHTLPLLREYGG